VAGGGVRHELGDAFDVAEQQRGEQVGHGRAGKWAIGKRGSIAEAEKAPYRCILS
jgi:hypothetical protein